MRKAFKSWIGRPVLFIFLTLFAAEAVLRIQQLFQSPVQKFQNTLIDGMVEQIKDAYAHPQKQDPFHLPYKIFSNDDYMNEEKLREVYEGTRYPPSTKWKTDDFLDPHPQKEFSVTIDRWGFRGPDREEKKAKGIRRIFVLGNYHAFGMGVDDSEVYSRKLEQSLNDNGDKYTYEVWNAGRLSAAAIVGLSVLKYGDIWRFDPDLVVLDYGFVDSAAMDESTFGITFFQLLSFHSLLWKKLNLTDRLFHVNRKYAGVMKEIFDTLREKGVPFLVLNQINSLSPSMFPQIFPPGTYLNLNVRDFFTRTPPPSDSWDQVPWLNEVPREYRRRLPAIPFAPFMSNPLQLNPLGHEVLARELARELSNSHLWKAEVQWSVQKLPGSSYFFRELNEPLGDKDRVKKAQLKTHDTVISLVDEARKSGTTFAEKAFIRIDLRNARVIESGLEITGKIPRNLDRNRIRKRSGGKFLVGDYSGPSGEMKTIFRELPTTLDRLKIKAAGNEAFYYKRTALPTKGESIRILLPLQ